MAIPSLDTVSFSVVETSLHRQTDGKISEFIGSMQEIGCPNCPCGVMCGTLLEDAEEGFGQTLK